MARGSDTDGGSFKSNTKSGKVGKGYEADFRGYINLNLTSEQRDAFPGWSVGSSPWDVLESSVGDGVNISLKIDPKLTGFIASATQRRAGSPNAGLVVTARAGSPNKALLRLLFCLAILGHEEKWETLAPMSDPDRW